MVLIKLSRKLRDNLKIFPFSISLGGTMSSFCKNLKTPKSVYGTLKKQSIMVVERRHSMETNIIFLHWLSKKLYLANVGLYATIIIIMALPPLLTNFFGIPAVIASLAVFFMVSLARATYESLVIYEAPRESLSWPKMLFLSMVTASTMSLISYFIKPKLGYFSIPVSVIIAMVIVGKLKALLWPATDRLGFFHELPAKLALSKIGMYIFYAILVGISYIAYNKYHINFNLAFASAFFIAMMVEEIFSIQKIYKKNIGTGIITSAITGILSAVAGQRIGPEILGLIVIGILSVLAVQWIDPGIISLIVIGILSADVFIDITKASARPKIVISVIMWSLICALASITIIWGLELYFEFPVQTATIISVVLLKLIQPWGFRYIYFRR